jgi:F-type H+-transporting ATPase subunit alpha
MKKVAGKVRLEAAQYRELAAFAQFGSDLDDETKRKLERGRRLTEIFKQGQYAPLRVADQVVVFWSLTNGHFDNVPAEEISRFETGLRHFLSVSHAESSMRLKAAEN